MESVQMYLYHLNIEVQVKKTFYLSIINSDIIKIYDRMANVGILYADYGCKYYDKYECVT
jgi:hypothetical protein